MTTEAPARFTAEMPRPRRAPLSALEEPVPLFAQANREFYVARRVTGVTEMPGGALIRVATADGAEAELAATATLSGALRLRWAFPPGAAGTVRDGDRMLGAGAEPDPGAGISGGDGAVVLATRRWRFELDRESCSWRLARPDGSLIVAQRTDDRAFVHWMSRPLGTSGGDGLRTWSHESLALGGGDRLYGLGQAYGRVDRRGTRTVQVNRDALGSNSSALSYHQVPVLLSTAGFGLVVHTAGRTLFECGWPSHDTLTVGAEGEVLDLIVLVGDTPRDLLRAHHALLGPPPGIPAWAMGVWMSRCQYASREEVMTVVARLDQLGFPLDVIHLDPRWMRLRRDADNDHGADFDWDEERFGDAAAFCSDLAARGVRVSLWENPYALRNSRALRELTALGGIARGSDGLPSPPFEAPTLEESFVVDFTAEAARRWWAAEHRRMLALGVAAFKTDFAEGVRDDARFADGRTGAELHNVYAMLFNRLVYETSAAAGTDHALVFGRSGWLGSHRYPVQWSGDSQCNWSDLRGAIRAGLSLMLSGHAWWGHDIGGFYRLDQPLPDAELYTRWAWAGLLSPISRFHGTSPREPYEYGDAAMAATRRAARLRYRLLPYLVEQARAASDGLPLMRPLPLAFPDDELAQAAESSWMLGDDLLVAPVLEPGGRRRVHLPAGRWHDWWTGAAVQGPATLEVSAGLDTSPIWQRAGTEVALGRGARVAAVLDGPAEAKPASAAYLD